ncbi:MAG: 6,7-dimethyl-8-ribityllumazine synthase [candidate division WOR-3 bacterium]|nr:6,7-dimethyl-8-ribityllumazine synthase [candidate division WOR-3 bacterium]MCX7947848.1 6,7-dimethyl-8-ribityllumazine synthase [candidate division WOR-3 bacterium]MDW8150670.1 6,7-dimethyl-8-ribityllumazine synthase [candidate division WOR-3 bacterium]
MIGIVASSFNSLITKNLLEGAESVLKKNGLSYEIYFVNGSFEIPIMIKLLSKLKKFDGFIAIGCIIKGETEHDKYIAKALIYGIMKLSLELEIPITFGIITAKDITQALDRAGGKYGNKGEESARALISILENLKK